MQRIEYVSYDELGGRPSIIVDGYGSDGTVMVLSHWPGSGSPADLAGDLSTQIAFNYLDTPALHVEADAVSNNHFDEDGLCGIHAILHPNDAQARRDQLIDVASAGDFGVWKDRASARIAMALTAYADESRSPLPIAGLPYPQQTAELYRRLLPMLAAMLDDPETCRDLWAEEDARLQRSLDAIAGEVLTITEIPEIDLAIVRGAASLPDGLVHEMAVHNATSMLRVLTVDGAARSLRYRYETWVLLQSRPVAPRLPLEPLAQRLTEIDEVPWTADDVDDLLPSARPEADSALTPATLEVEVIDYLQKADEAARG